MAQRRTILTLAGLLGLGMAARHFWPRATPELSFVDLPEFPPFRRLATAGSLSGPGSAADILFVGLAPEPTPQDLALRDRLRGDPFPALFREPAAGIPVAYFTDVRCPVCRALEADLERLKDLAPLKITTHDLPVFGEGSERAARAAIALGPDAASELRRRLQRSPAVVTEDYLSRVLPDADRARVMAALDSPDVEARLAETRALAALFGFVGTPGLVLGRTAILGRQPLPVLEAVLRAEEALPALL